MKKKIELDRLTEQFQGWLFLAGPAQNDNVLQGVLPSETRSEMPSDDAVLSSSHESSSLLSDPSTHATIPVSSKEYNATTLSLVARSSSSSSHSTANKTKHRDVATTMTKPNKSISIFDDHALDYYARPQVVAMKPVPADSTSRLRRSTANRIERYADNSMITKTPGTKQGTKRTRSSSLREINANAKHDDDDDLYDSSSTQENEF
jgi:hypothetical protein